MSTYNSLETVHNADLSQDLIAAVAGMAVSEEIVRKYCTGPHVEHAVARTILMEGPDSNQKGAPMARTAIGVIDLEQLFRA